jgi:hypothetical protein
MRSYALCLLVGILGSLQSTDAQAHFLFIRIGDQAEAGRAVDVYFSERAEAGDAKFISKVAHTKLWIQTKPGEFSPLEVRQATDRLRGWLPPQATVSVTGACQYGVLKRDVSFLLRYYPKAVSGSPSDLNTFKSHDKSPLEIMADFDGDKVALTLLNHGKPVPKAVFTTVDENLVNEELKADDSGRAVWKPGEPGQYCVYTKVVLPESGELDGKAYSEIREFATLAFNWPLGRTSPDPAAVTMFEKALEARAAWQKFPGFTADIAGSVDGREFSGKATVMADGETKLTLENESAAEWVEDQLRSIVLHRQAPSSPRKTPVLQFADYDEGHPLGRLVNFIGGRFASSYRIRGDEILVVNRSMGDENMTITVLDNDRNAEGKYLPRTFTVQYWDAKGRLLRTEANQNHWQRVGSWDLPTLLSVSTASETGLHVRNLRLSHHKMLETK